MDGMPGKARTGSRVTSKMTAAVIVVLLAAVACGEERPVGDDHFDPIGPETEEVVEQDWFLGSVSLNDENVGFADFSELLLSKLREGEEGLYYRRIPDPARIGLLIGAAFILAVALNTFLMGHHYEIDLAFQGSLLLGFGLLTLRNRTSWRCSS